MNLLFLMCVACAGCSMVLGYSTQAAPSACENMTPGHGTEQTGMSDFTLSVVSGLTNSKFSPGEPVTVQVDGFGVSFKGLLLQAREPDNTHPYGTWTNPPDNTKAMSCSNTDDSMTHANTNPKSTPINFTWTPPNGCEPGNVEFVATIAMEKEMWWLNHKTAQIANVMDSCSNAPIVTSVSMVTVMCAVIAAVLHQ